MSRASPFSRKVIVKAFPALVLAFFIFITLMFLISYTDAFYLVILLWIVVPVLFVKAYRRLKGWFE
jgi:lipopolysaccharide export LptBFGC system permease protein LptF